MKLQYSIGTVVGCKLRAVTPAPRSGSLTTEVLDKVLDLVSKVSIYRMKISNFRWIASNVFSPPCRGIPVRLAQILNEIFECVIFFSKLCRFVSFVYRVESISNTTVIAVPKKGV